MPENKGPSVFISYLNRLFDRIFFVKTGLFPDDIQFGSLRLVPEDCDALPVDWDCCELPVY